MWKRVKKNLANILRIEGEINEKANKTNFSKELWQLSINFIKSHGLYYVYK